MAMQFAHIIVISGEPVAVLALILRASSPGIRAGPMFRILVPCRPVALSEMDPSSVCNLDLWIEIAAHLNGHRANQNGGT